MQRITHNEPLPGHDASGGHVMTTFTVHAPHSVIFLKLLTHRLLHICYLSLKATAAVITLETVAGDLEDAAFVKNVPTRLFGPFSEQGLSGCTKISG